MSKRNNPVIVLALIFTVAFLVDLYAFQAVKTLTVGVENANLRQWIYPAYWALLVGIILLLVYGILSRGRQGGFSAFFKATFNVFLALFLAQLVLVVALFGEDIYRLTITAYNEYAHGNTTNVLMPYRNKIISEIGVVLAFIPFAAIIHGVTKGKYRYKVHHHTLYFDDLPEAFNNFTITQISDVHAGSFDNMAAVKKGIDLIKKQNSNLFVFTGDMVNNKAEEVEPYISLFKEIEAPYGKYSILGNHDYGDYVTWSSEAEKANNLEQLKQYHKEMGFTLLTDQHVNIQKDGQHITLLGVENWGLGFKTKGDLKKALIGVNADDFKLLLSHDPSHWDAEVKHNKQKIHLTLSGHTHGMQFGFEAFGFKWSPSKFRYKNWAGIVRENGRKLYVNRGFGFLGFDGRVGIWPEITVLKLKRKNSN